MTGLEELAVMYEERTKKTRQAIALVEELRKIIGSDRALARQIARSILQSGTAHAVAPHSVAEKGHSGVGQTHFQKIEAFFKANGNQWSTIDEVSHAIGVKRGAFISVLYSSHKGMFVHRRHPRKRRFVQWRFRQPDEPQAPVLKGGEP